MDEGSNAGRTSSSRNPDTTPLHHNHRRRPSPSSSRAATSSPAPRTAPVRASLRLTLRLCAFLPSTLLSIQMQTDKLARLSVAFILYVAYAQIPPTFLSLPLTPYHTPRPPHDPNEQARRRPSSSPALRRRTSPRTTSRVRQVKSAARCGMRCRG